MQRFARSQIYLHWLTLLLIAIAYAAIELRDAFSEDGPVHDFSKTLHFNAGILVWILMAVRLYLKHRYADPAIVPPPPPWQMALAKLMHMALYATFIALPVLGVLTQLYGGKNWVFMGIDVSGFTPADRGLARTIKSVHETWANVGYFLIAGHAGAAIWHHYVQRDNTLKRMMPGD